jgi:dTDP-4-dehydrorhamnose reductase
VNGYTNHQWNGVTTLHFARLCHGIITHQPDLPHVQHIIPTDSLSKCDLLRCFAREYRRTDISVIPGEAKTVIDRTLRTSDGVLNQRLWANAGYATPPTVLQMVAELAQYDYCLNEA